MRSIEKIRGKLFCLKLNNLFGPLRYRALQSSITQCETRAETPKFSHTTPNSRTTQTLVWIHNNSIYKHIAPQFDSSIHLTQVKTLKEKGVR